MATPDIAAVSLRIATPDMAACSALTAVPDQAAVPSPPNSRSYRRRVFSARTARRADSHGRSGRILRPHRHARHGRTLRLNGHAGHRRGLLADRYARHGRVLGLDRGSGPGCGAVAAELALVQAPRLLREDRAPR